MTSVNENPGVPADSNGPYSGQRGSGNDQDVNQAFRTLGEASENDETPRYSAEENVAPGDSITRAELDRILAERDRKHAAELAEVRTKIPTAVIPQHGGGPGNDNHQVSWNLAEQEAAARGDVLDHWENV